MRRLPGIRGGFAAAASYELAVYWQPVRARLASRFLLRAAFSVGALAALASACRSDSPFSPPLYPERVVEQKVAIEHSNAVDLLFVIDDSHGMREEQTALSQAFPQLLSGLRNGRSGATGTLPDLRVGIISSNLGAPGSRLTECEGSDRGVLQAASRAGNGACQATPDGRFLISLDNGTRNNFPGDLETAFGCVAELGTSGCGFEQHLAAARRALDFDRPIENEGFLRPDALLALIIVADEDDCSVPAGSDLFEPATTRYGPQGSYRCNEFGHLCGTDPPPRTSSPGPLANCQSAEDNGKLTPVADFVRFFRSLKARQELVLVSVIAGPPEPYAVGLAGNEAAISPSCESTARGGAAPAVRLQQFAGAFGGQGLFRSVCDGDLGKAMRTFGEAIARSLVHTCLEAPPTKYGTSDAGVIAADCAVSLRVPDELRERGVVPCDGSDARPCWRISAAKEHCTQSGYELKIEGTSTLVPGTTATARCKSCVDPKDPRCK